MVHEQAGDDERKWQPRTVEEVTLYHNNSQTIRYSFMRCILLCILLIYGFPQALFAQDEPINEEYLKLDKDNFINLMQVLKAGEPDLHRLKSNLKSLDSREIKTLGFATQKHQFAQYGGYITNWIEVYTFRGKIFYFRVAIIGEDSVPMKILAERDSVISTNLDKHWIRKSFNQNFGRYESIDYEYFNDSLYKKYVDTVRNTLGEASDYDVDSSILIDYQILTTPFIESDYGYSCYYGATAPIGRDAIENIKNRRPELLRNIIKGFSSEGRVYGIEALIVLAHDNLIELNEADVSLIKKIIALGIPISTCSGCSVMEKTAKEIFQNIDFEGLIK